MKIVASTKLSRAQRAMVESRSYGETSNTVFEKAETKPIESEDKKTLIIVCSSDKGLCGGIHSGLSRATRRMLEQKPNSDLVVVGEKSKAQLSRSNGKNIQLSFAGVGKDVPTFADAQAIADQISLLPTDYADIQILYNKFLNATSYEASPIEAFSEEAIRQSRNFPLPLFYQRPSLTKSLANFAAFEIDDEVLANLREYALANSLYWVSGLAFLAHNTTTVLTIHQALAEGHACEQSARRNAMDVSHPSFPIIQERQPSNLHISQNASKNAGDMINKFQILYNRTRQAVITGELVEIITGASASEG